MRIQSSGCQCQASSVNTNCGRNLKEGGVGVGMVGRHPPSGRPGVEAE